MATTTINVHVNGALNYKNKLGSLWLGLGRTQPWTNEEQPPVENMYVSDLDNLIGFKQVEKAALVVPITSKNGVDAETGLALPPTDDSQITMGGVTYQPIKDGNAFKYYARCLYLETTIEAQELPSSVYRQIGVYEDVIPVPSKNTQKVLLPSDVSNYGTLAGYDNIKFQRIDENSGVRIRIILEF